MRTRRQLPKASFTHRKGQGHYLAMCEESERKRVEALLLEFAQRNASPQPFSPDIEALRISLGMD